MYLLHFLGVPKVLSLSWQTWPTAISRRLLKSLSTWHSAVKGGLVAVANNTSDWSWRRLRSAGITSELKLKWLVVCYVVDWTLGYFSLSTIVTISLVAGFWPAGCRGVQIERHWCKTISTQLECREWMKSNANSKPSSVSRIQTQMQSQSRKRRSQKLSRLNVF